MLFHICGTSPIHLLFKSTIGSVGLTMVDFFFKKKDGLRWMGDVLQNMK